MSGNPRRPAPRRGRYDVEAVRRRLPHRYPFLLVDGIEESGPGYAIGIKNVTANESFFQGHFPGRSIMPGVLIAEALLQAAAFVGGPHEAERRGGGDGAGNGEPGPGAEGSGAGKREAAAGKEGAATARQEPAAREEGAGRQLFCAGIHLRFHRPVVPGDRLRLEVRLVRRIGNVARVRAVARSAAGVVAAGDLDLATLAQEYPT